MPFKRPCRIHNTAPTGVPSGFSGNQDKINATLTEYRDRYEWRLWIPRAGKRDLAVCIKDGILVVYEEAGVGTVGKHTVLGCFFVPANAQQTKARGFFRNYGLKIVMPLALGDGTLIKVPLIRQTESGSSLVLPKRT